MTHLRGRRANSKLDMPAYVGQRVESARFDIVDAITGYRRVVKPLDSGSPTLQHNTSSTITRTLRGLQLGPADTAVFSSISSRLEPFITIGGTEYPLGRYVPADWARIRFSSRANALHGVASFYDEMFIVDQQLTDSFGAKTDASTSSDFGEAIDAMLMRFLSKFPIKFDVDPMDPTANYFSRGSWSPGTRGGAVVEQLALDGDYLSPWFDHTSTCRVIRSFDPADQIPTFNFDEGSRVTRSNIMESDNLINSPNRFVVVGNGSDSFEGDIVGIADVPSSAPHSIANRGFVIPDVQNRQVQSLVQAGAVALNLVQRQTLVEQVQLETLPDPRHDSYDVIQWNGEKWLEIEWSLQLTPGGKMTHNLRRAYRP